jgi:DNA-binding MarR family transcriptional regulator
MPKKSDKTRKGVAPSEISEAGRPDPLDVVNCSCAALRRASRAASQHYDAALQPLGLKVTQFTLLASLARLGATRPASGLALSRLAELLVVERTTLTRNLKPMESRGLVLITPDEDQRRKRISITKAGEALFEEALPHWTEAQTRFLESLGKARWKRLAKDLDFAVVAGLGAKEKSETA